jgi:molybdenum cofactor guanylyltransferase
MKTLTAVLFAGGESRRMQVDKATLVLDDEPLWARQLRVLRALRPEAIMISARSKPVWCPPDSDIILDEPPSRGPLSGMIAALRKIQTTHLLALAIDLPGMTSEHLKKLWSLSQQGMGVVPQNENFFEPLCAIYPVESMGLANDALLNNDISLHGFIRTLAANGQMHFYAVTESEKSIYQNVNTPDQWRTIAKRSP